MMFYLIWHFYLFQVMPYSSTAMSYIRVMLTIVEINAGLSFWLTIVLATIL